MKWTAQQIEWLKALYPDTSNAQIANMLGRDLLSIRNKAVKLGLRKSDEYMATNPGCFHAEQKPWNKGKRWVAGGRSGETRFKKGGKPHTWNPVGHERLTKDGIWQRKVTDTGCTPRDYVAIHKLVWEEHNGPVPKGHIVVFKDGNRENFDPANLECISRKENMRRNSVHRLPKEVAELVQIMGALNRQINKRAQP
ncbi:hypothetical protein RE428_32110 [Marinobacter nanhaiticus D15-8W]|uniref:HNH endonuclease n=1 Tax=Marinobacter nanhaiticus D15-8W TaxID=626887 RepID=N6X6Z3_9GAMM|nr:HNH endonuclease signature motif containing protein [Marinobacter nanhaiticus]ENO16903.1 HNH endonuclease [Marinobacter nanhaiticus D15-8W]BES72193.1 hypothetical protein RE428_32110 [Marinobacter nanhaiticus D15-8W]